MRVCVITNDTYLWCLSPFAYLFNKYWSPEQEVVVVGYNKPSFELPKNFHFYSLGSVNAPQSRWSDGLIKFLTTTSDDFNIIMLEDYWISRPVDVACINMALEYMQENPYVLRFDLTGDVMHGNGDCRDATSFGFIGHYDIVEKKPNKEYRMSFQSAIWNNKLLLSLLKKGMNPWEVEMYTVIPEHILILGTKQWPLRYANAIFKGELDMKELEKIHPTDYSLIKNVFPDELRRKDG